MYDNLEKLLAVAQGVIWTLFLIALGMLVAVLWTKLGPWALLFPGAMVAGGVIGYCCLYDG